jgi:aerobic-type carbon monoxide dehydrogenase small subunit (CoxS/CutS family)
MPESKTTATLRVNGDEMTVVFPTQHSLLEVLREECQLTGTKHGCELGECGTCTVLVDGKPVLGCLMLAVEAVGKEITTVEGMARGATLHPLQETFADLGAAQCGYCTPGMLMTAQALIERNANPSDGEIREALSGNLCRCTGYEKIIQAVRWAAAIERGEGDAGRPTDLELFGASVEDQDRG